MQQYFRNKDKWIKRIDISRLLIASVGLAVVVLSYLKPEVVDIDFAVSNTVAIYVFLMGLKTHLVGKNASLAWFYMFFSSMMFIVVNIIYFRFG